MCEIMSQQQNNPNGQAESAALPTSEQLYADLAKLTPEQLGQVEALLTSLEGRGGGYLDSMYDRPVKATDYADVERLLDCIVAQLFAQLVRGWHITHETIYGTETSASANELFADLRLGVLAGFQDALPLDALMLQKLAGRMLAGEGGEAEQPVVQDIDREAQLQEIADLFDDLTPDEKRDFLAEFFGEHPDLLQQYVETVIIPKQKAEAQAKRKATLEAKKAAKQAEAGA